MNGVIEDLYRGGEQMPFQPGNQEWQKRRSRGEAPSLLTSMRKVFGQKKEDDRGPAQAHCRRLLEENIVKFFDSLAELEMAYSGLDDAEEHDDQESEE